MGRRKKPKKTRELTEGERGEVIGFLKAGWSKRKIATEMKCSPTAVQKIKVKYRKYGDVKNRPRPGRPRCSTDRQDRKIKFTSLSNRRLGAKAIGLRLQACFLRLPSISTIQRRLREAGLGGRVARKKPLLTPKHISDRKKWCNKYKDWTPEQWENVLWSDESPFTLFPSSGRLWIRRRVGEEYLTECIAPTVKFGGGKLHVWGCFSGSGVGDLYRCNGTFTGAKYREILKNHMAKRLRAMGKNAIFQQDNAPVHTAKVVQNYLANTKLKVLPWPSQSPDLNPIENLWAFMKRDLYYNAPRASNMDELFEIVKQAWLNIPKSLIRKLVHSMPKRIRAVLANRGGHTSY